MYVIPIRLKKKCDSVLRAVPHSAIYILIYGADTPFVFLLQKSIFEGIAQEALRQCVLSLQSAAQTIERNKVPCTIYIHC